MHDIIKNIKIFNLFIENFVLLKKEILKKYQNFYKKCNEIINIFNEKKNQKKNKSNSNENNFINNENNLFISNNLKQFFIFYQQFLTSKEKEIKFYNKIINEKKFFDITKISNAIEKLINDKKNYENNFKNLEKIKLKYNEYFLKYEKFLKEEFETKKFFSIEKKEKNVLFINDIIRDYKNLIVQIKQNKNIYFESLNNYLNSVKNFNEYENSFFQEIFKNLIEFNELHLLHNFFNIYSQNENNNENCVDDIKIDENSFNKVCCYEEYIPNLVKNKDLKNYYDTKNDEINDNNNIKDNNININDNENNNNENNINENNNEKNKEINNNENNENNIIENKENNNENNKENNNNNNNNENNKENNNNKNNDEINNNLKINDIILNNNNNNKEPENYILIEDEQNLKIINYLKEQFNFKYPWFNYKENQKDLLYKYIFNKIKTSSENLSEKDLESTEKLFSSIKFRSKFLRDLNKERKDKKLFNNFKSFNNIKKIFEILFNLIDYENKSEHDNIKYSLLLSQSFYLEDQNKEKIFIDNEIKKNKENKINQFLNKANFWIDFISIEINEKKNKENSYLIIIANFLNLKEFLNKEDIFYVIEIIEKKFDINENEKKIIDNEINNLFIEENKEKIKKEKNYVNNNLINDYIDSFNE